MKVIVLDAMDTRWPLLATHGRPRPRNGLRRSGKLKKFFRGKSCLKIRRLIVVKWIFNFQSGNMFKNCFSDRRHRLSRLLVTSTRPPARNSGWIRNLQFMRLRLSYCTHFYFGGSRSLRGRIRADWTEKYSAFRFITRGFSWALLRKISGLACKGTEFSNIFLKSR